MNATHSYRTLIIDDDPAIHEIFSDMLSPFPPVPPLSPVENIQAGAAPRMNVPSFEIHSAFRGEEGLACVRKALAQEQPYTMAFVDIRMPGWNGIETISRLWKEYFDLQVVICSGHMDFSWQDLVQRFGHSDRLLILRKPFDLAEVRQVAYSLVEKWELAHQAQRHLERLQTLVSERTSRLQEANLSLQRKIVENKQAERRLMAQFAVGHVLAETPTLEEAAGKVLRTVCENLNWDWGALWQVDSRVNVLRLGNCSHVPVDFLDAFKAISREMAVAPGQCLPGRAWHSTQPVWIRDVFNEPEFTRAAVASQCGLRTAVAFPLCIGPKVLGVMEFLSGEIREPDADLLQTFSFIGSALGQFMERMQAEDERKRMEVKLRHAQKLESIGQLAAGIAHEINTPTQYVGDNIRFIQSSFADLKKLNERYQELHRAVRQYPATRKLVGEIDEAVKNADVDFLIDEIPKAIEQSLEGVNRVARIVRAMKDFSHPGTGEKMPVDLNHAIETTLTVAGNEWKYIANIVTDFDEHLPSVLCLPGEFNQVILNLVVNAAHAIAEVSENGARGKGVITASTRHCGDWVEIRIRDTGAGIPAEIRHKIFDPFFTTKQVGKGTGQGLAIAHSVIVDQHQGTLAFETEPGAGTVFIVRLPLQPGITAKPEAAS